MTEELTEYPCPLTDKLARVAALYDSLGDTDRFYFPKVCAYLILTDLHRLPGFYGRKLTKKYRAMAERWDLTADDLAPVDGQPFQPLGPQLGLKMPPPPVMTGPLRSPNGYFLRLPPWLGGDPEDTPDEVTAV